MLLLCQRKLLMTKMKRQEILKVKWIVMMMMLVNNNNTFKLALVTLLRHVVFDRNEMGISSTDRNHVTRAPHGAQTGAEKDFPN